MSIHTYVLFFFLITLVSLLSDSMWKFISTQLTGQGLVTGPSSLVVCLVARIQCSHCCSLTSICGWELKSCFKPLQAEATRDHKHCSKGSQVPSPSLSHRLHSCRCFGAFSFLLTASFHECFPIYGEKCSF